MADAIRFNLDGEHGRKIRRLFERMSGPALDAALHEFGSYKVSRIVRAFPRTPFGVAGSAGGPPAVQTSLLRHSITYDLGRILRVGTNLIYGAIRQFGTAILPGGVLRPKRAKALTIPISPEAYGKRARDFSNTFILRRADDEPGEGLIMLKLASGEAKPLFALRKSVKQEARPYLGWDERDRSKLLGILNWHFEAQP